MNKDTYRWKRRWIPREHEASGKLLDNWTTDFYYFGGFSNDSSYEINELLGIPCLILLGEPGMGKSFAINDLKSTLISNDDDRYCFFDLADYESNTDLIESVFKENTDFHEWESGAFRLHLFLDSLDEAKVQIKAVAERLIKHLQRYPDVRSRMTVRIACRTADWPTEQETNLRQLWDKDHVEAFILAPLRSEDISLALESRGVDEPKFREEIKLKGVEPFCSRPITFNLLLDEYCQTGKLPNTRYELYRRGCAALCRETNQSHAKEDRLQPEQRFLIAARIAAIMVFTGHQSVLADSSTVSPHGVLSIEAFTGKQDQINGLGTEKYVYEADVKETLETALFRGDGKRQWVHQTYAEFLAGWYVSQTLQTSQIRSLLFHPSRKVIPQLREAAAWVAALRYEISAEILDSDPEILLRSDVATCDYESKNRLAQALLQRAGTSPLFRSDWSRIKLLKNPSLASTLRPYLENAEESIGARRFAILCSNECEVKELQNVLLKIALNQNESAILRDAAVEAVGHIGSDDSKAQIKPIAIAPLSAHNSGDLKFEAIRCVWPEFMTTEELFQALDADARENVIDRYSTADWCKLIFPNLSVTDIPAALKWVQQQKPSYELLHAFIELFDGILALAWSHLENPEIAGAFAETAITLWSRHDDIYSKHGFRQTSRNEQEDNPLSRKNIYKFNDRRYILLDYLIPLSAYLNQDISWNFISDVPFLCFADAPWLVTCFDASQSSEEKRVIVSLLKWIIDLREQSQFEFIYAKQHENPELWLALNYQLSIELNSPESADAEERYTRIRKMEKEREESELLLAQENKPISPTPTEQVREYLKQLSEGDATVWWLISKFMMYLPNGRYNRYHQVSPRLNELPVWTTLDETEKAMIVDQAEEFLNSYDCEALDWRANWKTIYYPIVAGYRALFISCTHDRISKLNFERLSIWVPALVSHIYQWAAATGDEEPNPKDFLLKLLYIINPAKTIEAFLWLAGKDNGKGEHFLPSHINHLWDKRLSRAFLTELQQNRFSSQLTYLVLQQIAAHDYSLIDDLLREWAAPGNDSSPENLDRSYAAACLLFMNGEHSGWEVLRPIFQSNKEFGREVIRRVAGEDRHIEAIISKLTERDAADFYIWLYEWFPPLLDPNLEDDFWASPEHEITSFRGSVIGNLISRGTEEGIYSLQYIQKSLGKDYSGQISQAEVIWRKTSWQPPSVQEMRTLIQDQKSRWIQNGSQLLEVITELLLNLNDDLQGKSIGTPSAIDLWNECKIKAKVDKVKDKEIVYTPKDENRLSDYVERYLRRMLVDKNLFISRESQIQRGSFTDIYIETRRLDDNGPIGEPIIAVVEVKGCWNSELRSAMEVQLRDRYLKENGLKYGLYLIGRFMCDKWSKSDSRWKSSPKKPTVMEMQEMYTQQAKELSANGLDIRAFVLNAGID